MEKPTGYDNKKYYAVRKGLHTGIYTNWQECKENVTGYKGAEYKSFKTEQEAIDYLTGTAEQQNIDNTLPYAYIDGSFNETAGLYSYGGFIHYKDTEYLIQGTGSAADYLQYRNIVGEVRGAIAIIQAAIKLGISEINLYYDYTGIENWACGLWETKNKMTQYYKDFYQKKAELLKIHFIHIQGHTGNEGNELADLLAKDAAGVSMSKKKMQAVTAFKDKAATI